VPEGRGKTAGTKFNNKSISARLPASEMRSQKLIYPNKLTIFQEPYIEISTIAFSIKDLRFWPDFTSILFFLGCGVA
jgi:hypothetical protein